MRPVQNIDETIQPVIELKVNPVFNPTTDTRKNITKMSSNIKQHSSIPTNTANHDITKQIYSII